MSGQKSIYIRVQIIIMIIFILSVAKITPATKVIYTVDTHIVNCVLTDLIKQVTVTWSYDKTVASFGSMYVKQGTFKDHAQTSTWTLTSEQVKKMKAVDGTHLFTCKITVGDTPTDYKAIQTAKIYTPGKSIASNYHDGVFNRWMHTRNFVMN